MNKGCNVNNDKIFSTCSLISSRRSPPCFATWSKVQCHQENILMCPLYYPRRTSLWFNTMSPKTNHRVFLELEQLYSLFVISEPNKKKKCFAKKKWEKTKPGQSPVKWNFANMDFECVRDYLGKFQDFLRQCESIFNPVFQNRLVWPITAAAHTSASTKETWCPFAFALAVIHSPTTEKPALTTKNVRLISPSGSMERLLLVLVLDMTTRSELRWRILRIFLMLRLEKKP